MSNSITQRLKSKLRKESLSYRILKACYKLATNDRFNNFLFWLNRGHIIRLIRVKLWLYSPESKYLQVGGGKHTQNSPQWLNGDIIAGNIHLDARKKLPFPDSSIDIVFTEQFIEHLTQSEAIAFLKETYRILKPGGVIRHSTPDLKKIIDLYDDKNSYVSSSNAIKRHMKNHRPNDFFTQATTCQIINDLFRMWGHQYIYDENGLKSVILECGFKGFKWVNFGSSENEPLKHAERHADEEWMKNGLIMICEATK